MSNRGGKSEDGKMIGHNTLEGRALAMAERIERLQIEIEDEQDRCRELCRPMREDIAEIWKEAKGGELPEKAMRAYVKIRAAQRKALAKLSSHERDAFDRLREALGPLGADAAERAGYPAPDDDVDLRPRFKRTQQVDLDEAIASKAAVPADLSPTPHVSTADAPFHPPGDDHYRGLDEGRA